MIGPQPECYQCKHFNLTSAQGANSDPPTCAAFPDGIPGAIFFSGQPHHKTYPGDHGIHFEKGTPTGEGAPPKQEHRGFHLPTLKS